MKNTILRTIFITSSIFSIGILSSNAVLAETGVTDSKNLKITGKVIDSKNSAGIKDVYVKQLNTLNTVLSDENGNFVIQLDSKADRKLLINKEGYEPIQLNIVPGDTNYQVTLFPALRSQSDSLPPPHTDVSDIFNYATRPISSNFSALYQLRYQTTRVPSLSSASPVTSSGWAINEIGLNAQIRFDKWMGQIKVFRSRYPVDMDNFNYSPVYNLDTLQFQVSGGRVYKLSDKMDFYGGLSYLLHYNTPDNRGGSNNKPIPYTNSYMDFPQTRQGPGVTAILGYMLSDKIILNGGATLYPFVFTSFDDLSKNNIGYHGMLDLGANIKVETIPGVYVTGGYSNQFFFGFSNFLDDSNFFNIGVTLDPFKMANVNPEQQK